MGYLSNHNARNTPAGKIWIILSTRLIFRPSTGMQDDEYGRHVICALHTSMKGQESEINV